VGEIESRDERIQDLEATIRDFAATVTARDNMAYVTESLYTYKTVNIYKTVNMYKIVTCWEVDLEATIRDFAATVSENDLKPHHILKPL
jgi:hypothetical protein